MQPNGFKTITSLDRDAPFVEAYGFLLVSVLLGSNGKPPNVVAVAAAQPGDGTSTIAVNLALMMSRSGRPTALVDANFRRPELHKAFELPQTPGLAEVLAGQVEFKSAAGPTRVPNLSLLPAGNTEAPVLLSQSGLTDVFGLMRGRFDLVVVDTPPLLHDPDALQIAACVDGVLLVVASHGASRRDQQEARRLLERVEARILGTVLNRVRSRGSRRLARVP